MFEADFSIKIQGYVHFSDEDLYDDHYKQEDDYLTEDQGMKKFAYLLEEIFNEGFSWKDFPKVIVTMLDSFPQTNFLSLEEKKLIVYKTLTTFVYQNKGILLPSSFSLTLYEDIIPHLINAVANSYQNYTNPQELYAPNLLMNYSSKLASIYSYPLNWGDLFQIISHTNHHMQQYLIQNNEEKQNIAEQMLNCFLDEIDEKYLPFNFDTDIFFSLANSFIDQIPNKNY